MVRVVLRAGGTVEASLSYPTWLYEESPADEFRLVGGHRPAVDYRPHGGHGDGG
jgi:hypothetical protein